jgi:nitrite reductase (cytochrome c-552)
MSEATQGSSIKKYALIAGISAIGVIAITALLVNIFERKQEGRSSFFQLVELSDTTEDPAIWGKNFPFQYDGYKKTTDMNRTRFGGSEAVPKTPTQADPRSIVAQSRLEEDPRLKKMWAGYAFSIDFREERGHAYMLEDQTFTERQNATKQPGACINCHASMYVPMMKAGNGDLIAGFEKLNKMPYQEVRALVSHSIACIDCHDPKTMELRVTRPAFMEGMKNLKMSQGITDYDVNRDATHQEMRSFVCGQCHDEYYFKGTEKRLTYPWSKGLKIENILAYYDEVGHKDWTHKETNAPVLKAQHPEFEMWNQGIHGRSGVSCADCHMPYKREGAIKVSDHQVRSPLLNINNACQSCHPWPEEELKARVESIQEKTFEIRGLALDALLDLIDGIQSTPTGNTSALEEARAFQRKAQFYVDFIEAENSMGFHAPEESLRILAKSIDFSRRGIKALGQSTPTSAPTSQP